MEGLAFVDFFAAQDEDRRETVLGTYDQVRHIVSSKPAAARVDHAVWRGVENQSALAQNLIKSRPRYGIRADPALRLSSDVCNDFLGETIGRPQRPNCEAGY